MLTGNDLLIAVQNFPSMTKPPQDDHYQNQMTKSYISCYNMPYKDLQHFEVPEPVYIYIRQLENEIINHNGAVQRLYPGRFEGKAFDKEDFDYQTYIEDYK